MQQPAQEVGNRGFRDVKKWFRRRIRGRGLLARSGGEEVEKRAQSVAARTKRSQARLGFRAQSRDFTATSLDAVDAGIGQFAGVGIFPRRFPCVFGCLRCIDQVVDDLEHQTCRAPEPREPIEGFSMRVYRECTHATRRFEQRARLVVMDQFNLPRGRQALGEALKRVVDLTGNHADGARHEFALDFRHIVTRTRRRNRSECQKAITRKNRHRLTECDVAGGLSAAHGVVIKRGQIVVDEAKGVDEFDRDSGRHRGVNSIVARTARRARRFKDEDWSQPFATRKHGVKAGRAEIGWNLRLLQKVGECVFNGLEKRRVERRDRSGRRGARHMPQCSRTNFAIERVARGRMSPSMGDWDFFSILERGGFVMWPLFAVSVIALAISLERLWFWLRLHSSRETQRYRKILRAFRNGDRSKAEELINQPGNIYDQLAQRMLDDGPDDSTAVEVIEDLRGQTERFSGVLSSIITASPMLGILGTVTGIIQSFELLGGTRALVDPRDVSAGIAEALITTAGGLIIALGALFPYMIFRAQSERALGRFEAIVSAAKQGLGPTRNWSVKK